MEKMQSFMLNHPYISMAVILPFTLVFVIGIFSFLIQIVIPVVLAIWLAGWVYTAIVGRPVQNYYRRPFWYIRY